MMQINVHPQNHGSPVVASHWWHEHAVVSRQMVHTLRLFHGGDAYHPQNLGFHAVSIWLYTVVNCKYGRPRMVGLTMAKLPMHQADWPAMPVPGFQTLAQWLLAAITLHLSMISLVDFLLPGLHMREHTFYTRVHTTIAIDHVQQLVTCF